GLPPRGHLLVNEHPDGVRRRAAVLVADRDEVGRFVVGEEHVEAVSTLGLHRWDLVSFGLGVPVWCFRPGPVVSGSACCQEGRRERGASLTGELDVCASCT